jgi:hypothetical protein
MVFEFLRQNMPLWLGLGLRIPRRQNCTVVCLFGLGLGLRRLAWASLED